MSQKYVIVHFVDKVSVPDEFPSSDWPLHVTLLANFTIDQPLEQLVTELSTYAKLTKPFVIIADGEARFGPDENVAVSLIQPSESIAEIHHQLSDISTGLGAVYDEPRFMGDGYRPHATIQVSARISNGQAVTVDNFTLVGMYPHEDIKRRKIIKTFSLGG
jgi:2'-5' RNA ligase